MCTSVGARGCANHAIVQRRLLINVHTLRGNIPYRRLFHEISSSVTEKPVNFNNKQEG